MDVGDGALETYFHERGVRFVAGVDEVGRGPLAGPVAACACLIPVGTKLEGVRDSKALTPRARKKVFWDLLKRTIVGIGVVGEREIDRINILNASLLAMRQAVLTLPITPDLILVDGNKTIDLPIEQMPIVGGDKRTLSIAAASIVAKVTRDELMAEYDEEYPAYGFSKHKGYPTPEHLAALEQNGPCAIHRRSFGPVERVVEAAEA